jgi:cell division protein FtsI (penicillin-binding protein 3)
MSNQSHNQFLFRTYLVAAGVLVMAILIFGKVAQIQFVEGEKWRSMEDSLYIRMVPVESEMGNILTEDGTILATSTVRFEIRMDLASSGMKAADFRDNLDSLSWYLAKYVDSSINQDQWKRKLASAKKAGDRYFLIANKASYDDVALIRQFPLFRLGRYKGGLIILEHPQRTRPFGALARRTIGIHETDGKSYGIESKYKDVLLGEQGYRLMQFLPGGVKLPVQDLTEIAPTPGLDVVTTLDVGMQDMAHAALEEALLHHKAESGIAAIMEVSTGKIRAMVNLENGKDGCVESFNHIIGSAVEPGSIFKAASMLALLDDGYVKPDDLVDLEKGQTIFYDRTMVDAYPHGLDTVTVNEVFAQSSNVGIAKLVQRYYGAQPGEFIEQLAKFGLTNKMGIDLEGEATPLIKHPKTDVKSWSGITLPWMSMGYETKVTPLQMLTLYAAIANGGKMMRPMMVSEIQRNGDPIRKIHPQVLSKKIAGTKSIKALQNMMRLVIEEGTGKKWKTEQYSFAGKTGTAHIRDRKGDRIEYRSSFAGYFPADNPRYAVIVIVQDPTLFGYYGSEVALPVFRRIADYCHRSRMEMFPDLASEDVKQPSELHLPQWEAGWRSDFSAILSMLNIPHDNQSKSEWTVTKTNQESKLELHNRNVLEKQIPNVVGMGLRDALYLLENCGLKVDPHGIGKVRRQSITAGTPVKGQYVRIYLE